MKRLTPFAIGLTGIAIGWFLHEHYPSQQSGTESQSIENTTATIIRDHNQLDKELVVSEPALEQQLESRETLLAHALQEKDYERAISIYTQHFDVAAPPENNTARKIIINTLSELYSKNLLAGAKQLLELYLTTAYKDIDALLFKAKLLAAMGDRQHQIETLYEAKSYAYRETVIQDIERQIRNTVNTYTQDLQTNNRPLELLELYQTLTYREPNYSPYFIELAKAQLNNQLYDEAGQSLNLVKYDPLVGVEAQRLLATVDQQNDHVTEETITHIDDTQSIPLLRQGNHYIVEARLNNQVYLNLIIDTGASLTIIKPESLYSILGTDLQLSPTHAFNTANGTVHGAVLKVDSLAIGNFEVANLDVGSLGLENITNADGLLGMNFLQNFRFFIDQESNTLRLSLNQ